MSRRPAGTTHRPSRRRVALAAVKGDRTNRQCRAFPTFTPSDHGLEIASLRQRFRVFRIRDRDAAIPRSM